MRAGRRRAIAAHRTRGATGTALGRGAKAESPRSKDAGKPALPAFAASKQVFLVTGLAEDSSPAGSPQTHG